jgi:hypothetical protein
MANCYLKISRDRFALRSLQFIISSIQSFDALCSLIKFVQWECLEYQPVSLTVLSSESGTVSAATVCLNKLLGWGFRLTDLITFDCRASFQYQEYRCKSPRSHYRTEMSWRWSGTWMTNCIAPPDY